MLKLIRLNDDAFITRTENRAIHGNRARTIAVLLMLNIDDAEIEAGLSQLINRGDHMAEYGVNGTFIYSKKLA